MKEWLPPAFLGALVLLFLAAGSGHFALIILLKLVFFSIVLLGAFASAVAVRITDYFWGSRVSETALSTISILGMITPIIAGIYVAGFVLPGIGVEPYDGTNLDVQSGMFFILAAGGVFVFQASLETSISTFDADRTNSIYKAPGSRLLRVLRLICSKQVYEGIEQIWADTLEDYYKALEQKDEFEARFSIWSGYRDITFVVVGLLPTRLLRWVARSVTGT